METGKLNKHIHSYIIQLKDFLFFLNSQIKVKCSLGLPRVYSCEQKELSYCEEKCLQRFKDLFLDKKFNTY